MTSGATTRTLQRLAGRLRLRPLVTVHSPRPARRTRSARRAAGVAVVAGVVAFAGLQFALAAAARTAFIADPYYADKEWRLRKVEASAPGVPRVTFLGTSRTLNGFAAGEAGREAAEAGLPGVAFNFGIPGAGPITHTLYLRRLLADGHAPSLLLLEVLPAVFTDLTRRPSEAWLLAPDRLTLAEADLVIDRYGFPAEATHAHRAAADRCPWQAHRFKMLGRVMPEAVPWGSRTSVCRTDDPHGWRPHTHGTEPDPQLVSQAAEEYRDRLRNWTPGVGPEAALRDLLALCRAEGIAVTLVLMPEASSFRDLLPPPAGERLNRFLAGMAAEYGCALVDAREWMPDGAFVDGHHLFQAGARTFTHRLATEAILPFLRNRVSGKEGQ